MLKMWKLCMYLILLVKLEFCSVVSLNILGVFPYQGRSHFFVFEKYLERLAEKGHNLTIISHFPRKEFIPNYHDVSLAGEIKIAQNTFPIVTSVWNVLNVIAYTINAGNVNCKVLLENESVQELWKTKTKFDLVVMEHFNSDCGLGLAFKLRAPVIGLTANNLMPWQYRSFGIPFNPSYAQFIFTGGYKPTLKERIERAIYDYIYTMKYANGQKVDQETLSKYFNDVPPLEQLSRDMKFLFLYQNFVLSGPKLLPPNVVEVGGYHVMPPKPLPTPLLKFIEESKHGIIYISFGSMVKESSLPKEKMDAILDALAELPQRVVWKWNADFPGDQKNFYVSDWLPQNDILAHPNVLAFFSHCGQLSATETAFHGVPMVAMPVFADQLANAAALEEFGWGVQITLDDITKDSLLRKFRIVLSSNFRDKVKIRSRAYSARPASAMASAIFWTEFAAQHNLTVSHPAVDVPLYQYLCLDVIAVSGIFAFICFFVIFKVLLKFWFGLRNFKYPKVKVKGN